MSAAVEREGQKADTIIARFRITDQQYALLPNDEDVIRCHGLAGAVSSSPPNDWSAIATMKGEKGSVFKVQNQEGQSTDHPHRYGAVVQMHTAPPLLSLRCTHTFPVHLVEQKIVGGSEHRCIALALYSDLELQSPAAVVSTFHGTLSLNLQVSRTISWLDISDMDYISFRFNQALTVSYPVHLCSFSLFPPRQTFGRQHIWSGLG